MLEYPDPLRESSLSVTIEIEMLTGLLLTPWDALLFANFLDNPEKATAAPDEL